MSLDLRALQTPIRERYRNDPAAARIEMTARSASSDLGDPLHCAISPDSAPGVVWRSGAHPGVGGAGDVPCSGDLLVGALAACQEVTLRMVAASMGLELEEVEVVATGVADLRGTLAMDRSIPVGVTSIECRSRVKIKGDPDPERSARFLASAERYCVVLNTLRSGVAVTTEFQVDA